MAFYERDNVKVDEHFARFGSKAFAINKINSVEVRVQNIAASKAWLVFAIVAALFLVGVFGAETGEGKVQAGIIAAVLAGIAVLLFRVSKPKKIFHLFLMTSSSEVQAYSTEDADDIRKLRHAIEEAIVGSPS